MPPYIAPYTLRVIREEFALSVRLLVRGWLREWLRELRDRFALLYYLCSVNFPWYVRGTPYIFVCIACYYSVNAP